ncbi:MAG: hypothetical protein AAB533_00505 [Patescibacteria group bacterium]
MNLLSQYNKDHPEAFQEQKAVPMTDEYGREYTTMVRWVIRLSGGRIRDGRTATYTLMAVAAIIFIISLFLFFRGGGASLPPAREILRDTPTSGLRPGAEITP